MGVVVIDLTDKFLERQRLVSGNRLTVKSGATLHKVLGKLLKYITHKE